MRALLLASVIASGSMAACRSAPPPEPASHPYRVVLLPVEGAQAALTELGGPKDVPLAMTAEQLGERIRERIVESRVFSDVLVVSAADLQAPGTDRVATAADLARQQSCDLILRLVVKSARMKDLGENSSTFWSTLTWTLVPLPLWFVDDRTYDTMLTVQAELYDPAEPLKPTASLVASSGKQDLDLWDRGLSWYVFVVPPAFLEGSDAAVSETLTERAVDQLLAVLVEELRKRDIPSRFDIQVGVEGRSIRLRATSRRRLRRLAVESGGRPLAHWAENELLPDGDSTPERFVYTRTVELSGGADAAVRVQAEDESGGVEMRTVMAGSHR